MTVPQPTVVEVALEPPYRVTVGAGLLERAMQESAHGSAEAPRVALLADERVLALYQKRLDELAQAPCLALVGGESAKTFARLEEVLSFLAAEGLDRRSLLFTLGGGTLLDLGGLAASLFKRGIGVIHLPTTLLAQVDAAVGGKTAINLDAGKNLVGTFHQPRAVLADTGLLATLDGTDWRSGLGECVKTALVGGEKDLVLLEQLAAALAAREPDAVHEVVATCVRTKAAVVAADPTEGGPRRALNLGHTFAHGIEHATEFQVPHGVAVAVGLRLALRASRILGQLADEGLEARIADLLARLGLPATLSELEALAQYGESTPDRILAGMSHDKKGAVGAPELVLPRRAGDLALGIRAEPAQLLEILRST